jgi:HEAT repeat protein
MTAAILLLVLLAAPAAPPAIPTTEAVIENRTVDSWVADLRSEDDEKRRSAHAALMKAGPKAKGAVPALTKMLSEENVRWFAAEILGEIGPDAKDAVPALLALLPKEPGFNYSPERIASAVAKIDGPKIEATRALLLSSGKCQPILLTTSSTLYGYPEQVVSHLVTLCDDKNATVRTKAAIVLGTLKEKEVAKVPTKTLFERAGDGAKGVIPALEKLLADDDTKVRLAAANAITHVAPELAEKVISAVIAIATKSANRKTGEPHAADIFRPISEQATKALIPLFDSEEDLRWWAINTLASLPGREQLEDALKNGKTARTREAAAITLGSRYGEAAASIPALKAALEDAEFVVRFAAANAIVRVGPTGSDACRDAVPVLVEGLQHNQEQTRLEASETLQSVGTTAKDAIPALKKLLTDNKLEVRLEAAFALVAIDAKDAAGSVPALIEGLKASDSQATRAAKALAKLGPVAKDAVPELVKHFGAKNLHLRLYSAEAVARIDATQAPKAIDVFVALLQDKSPKMHGIHRHTISAIHRIGSPAKAAMPALAAMLTDDVSFRVESAVAMIAIDPDGAKPAFDWMRAVLTKDRDDDAFDLAERLPELGAKVKPLVPELTRMLQSKTLHLRLHAIETLGAIGPDAKDALPELKKLAESDPREHIRDLAAEAIQKIEK